MLYLEYGYSVEEWLPLTGYMSIGNNVVVVFQIITLTIELN